MPGLPESHPKEKIPEKVVLDDNGQNDKSKNDKSQGGKSKNDKN